MQERKYRFIIIEGTDGSGKKTQTKLLRERLEQSGKKTAEISFPQYGKKSAGLVEEYLNGTYGKPDEVNPYAASLFYALDRFDLAPQIKKILAEGYTIISDRYVDSNAGHQGGKISSERKREKFLLWLYDIEYRILGIPKPNLVIILHVPAEIGQKLIYKKQERFYLEKGTHDSHEADLAHLKNAEAAYLWLAKKFPEDHKIIECVENKEILTPEEIHARVWNIVQEY